MRFLDLNDLDDDSVLESSLCVVGTGPAGASIALEFEGTGIDVLVLESGGYDDDADTQRCYEIETVGETPRRIDQDELRRRVLGGSSRIWTGRCAPFSELDLAERSWIPYSGWPLTLKELEPYLQRAAIRLGLAPNSYDESLWKGFGVKRPSPSLDAHLLEPMFWQFSKSPDHSGKAANFASYLLRSNASNLRVLLHANVTHINTNAEGTSFASVEVRSLQKKHALVRARAVVVACGGVENARLLLASSRLMPNGVGNDHDIVGRFLMDHTTCVLGNFPPQEADPIRERFGHYWLDNSGGRNVYLQGLALSGEIQQREHLLNCHAYVEEYDPAVDDPWSALRQLKSAISARLAIGRAFGDARTVLAHFGEVGLGFYRRLVKHRPELVRVNRLELHCMMEQVPDPESRITLSADTTDPLGMALSKIRWKMSELERHTARRMSQLVSDELRRLGLPAPLLTQFLDEDDWMAHFVERAHPAGSTRMSIDAKQGVVDRNSQVHGVRGLFVSGSSVFPTSGAANPTLMIVAMALRLADRLKQTHFNSSTNS